MRNASPSSMIRRPNSTLRAQQRAISTKERPKIPPCYPPVYGASRYLGTIYHHGARRPDVIVTASRGIVCFLRSRPVAGSRANHRMLRWLVFVVWALSLMPRASSWSSSALNVLGIFNDRTTSDLAGTGAPLYPSDWTGGYPTRLDCGLCVTEPTSFRGARPRARLGVHRRVLSRQREKRCSPSLSLEAHLARSRA